MPQILFSHSLAYQLNRRRIDRLTTDNIHHIRCPICGGRLFDVITGKGENSYFGTNFAVMIKCWKCRETITLKPLNNINYLVQASHVCLKSE